MPTLVAGGPATVAGAAVLWCRGPARADSPVPVLGRAMRTAGMIEGDWDSPDFGQIDAGPGGP